MLVAIRRWVEHRRAIRRRWQADARRLILVEEINAYYEAQRRATRARLQGDAGEFYHWAKVAAEIARISPQAAMDVDVVREIVTEEERRRT
jgi:hypothetical protein